MRARSGSVSLALAILVALATFALPATAQGPLPPTLEADTAFAPPTGIARHDFQTGTAPDVATAAAVFGDRIYTVGETRSGGDTDIGIIARRSDGTFDSTFSEDGKLVLPIAPPTGRDTASGVAVLPDGRLRLVGATDVDSSGAVNMNVAVVGLRPDGTPDPDFGGADGIVVFPVGTGNDGASRVAVDASGRLAITGATSNGAQDDTFVALLEADGSPAAFGTAGVRVVNRGGGAMNDRGLDVAFRPGGGVVVLAQVETAPDANGNDWVGVLHAFKDAGPQGGADDPAFSEDGDLVLGTATPDPVPGGLIAYGGRLWAASATRVGVDVDAYLARVGSDGSDLQLRRFDMRGRFIAADQAVTSQAIDLDVLSSPPTPSPPTLVVAGSVTSEFGTDWAAAAFNGLDGALDAAGFGDLVIPSLGQRPLVGVAAGGEGWVGAAGELQDPNNTADSGFGTARLLVDRDKQCDLAIEVLEPLEIALEDGRPASLKLRVSNSGTKACATGSVNVSTPYELRLAGAAGPLSIPALMPKASTTVENVQLTYAGPRRREDVVGLTVTVAGDANPANDRRNVRVVFRFCDVSPRAVSTAGVIPDEGFRRFEVSVRNLGTASCRRIRLGVARGGRAAGGTDPYALDAGRSASDEIAVAAPRGARLGTRLVLVLRASADGDVDPANDTATVRPVVIGVGDSDARRPGRRLLQGTASPGRGRLSRRARRVTKVEVAVRRLGGGCRWLASSATTFRTVATGPAGRCERPVWLRARGTRRWRLVLRRALPRGRYVLSSRATIAAGYPESSFTARDRNRITFHIR